MLMIRENGVMEKTKWERLYNMVGGLTPLKHDCGRLCGKKCCSVQEEGKGIYLFPGEESMYRAGGESC
ncbi:MAG: hypothetical protein ACOY4I_12535 [Bacillota bacterium]